MASETRQRGAETTAAMMTEAGTIVEMARRRSLDLRLIGGLAVRARCRDETFCARAYRDIDLVGRRRQIDAVAALLAELGYEENLYFRLASAGRVTQFFRPCAHAQNGVPAHEDDRVDLYLDDYRLDHHIRLSRRLATDELTVPAADVLLVKLQRTAPNDDDVRDMIALLQDVDLEGKGGAGAETVQYISRLCARDWGLHHDVALNLGRCREGLSRFGLAAGEAARVERVIGRLEHALTASRKTARWKLRALFGERLPWSDAVDDRDGRRISLGEGPVARQRPPE